MSRSIIYSRGFPYGAPLVMLRGGATRVPEVKEFLKVEGFRWNGHSHAWENYLNAPELTEILLELRDCYECEVTPKEGMDTNYILDLEGK